MKRHIRVLNLSIVIAILFSLIGCKNASDNPVFNTFNDDPLQVAEYALECLSQKQMNDFMKLTPYYESSFLYSELNMYVETCVEEFDTINNLEYEHYWIEEIDSEFQQYLTDEGVGEVESLKSYYFKDPQGDWIAIYMGKIRSQWYVMYIDYCV